MYSSHAVIVLSAEPGLGSNEVTLQEGYLSGEQERRLPLLIWGVLESVWLLGDRFLGWH